MARSRGARATRTADRCDVAMREVFTYSSHTSHYLATPRRPTRRGAPPSARRGRGAPSARPTPAWRRRRRRRRAASSPSRRPPPRSWRRRSRAAAAPRRRPRRRRGGAAAAVADAADGAGKRVGARRHSQLRDSAAQRVRGGAEVLARRRRLAGEMVEGADAHLRLERARVEVLLAVLQRAKYFISSYVRRTCSWEDTEVRDAGEGVGRPCEAGQSGAPSRLFLSSGA